MNKIHVRVADWQKDNAEIRRIREAVFIAEQSVPPELEWDSDDNGAVHFLAFEGDFAIGTARLLPDGHVGRVSVLKDWRGLKVGDALMRAVIDEAEKRGLKQQMLSAQVQATPFYERLGFSIVSEEFLADDGEAQALVERRGLDLGAEHLLLEAAFLGFIDDGAHQRVADFQAAPVLEYRDPADVAVGQQARGADGEVALESQEVHGAVIVGIPLQLGWDRLFGNEYRFTNAPDLGVILLPVCDTYVNLIHRQIPGSLA